jgi:hypothetical protein
MPSVLAEPNCNINTTANSTVLIPNPTSASAPFAFIAVLSYDIIANGASNVSLQDTQGNVYAGPQDLVTQGGLVKNVQSGGYCFTLPKGAGLVLVQDGGAQLGGSLQFRIIMR